MGVYFSSRVFWGVVFVFIGILLIIRNYVNVNIPVFRIIFGLLIIYWGISILFGMGRKADKSSVIFSNNTVNANSGSVNRYETVFGKTVINFTDTTFSETKKIVVNVVFGEVLINVDKNIPVKLKLNDVFSSIKTPYGEQPTFGSSVTTNKLFRKSNPYLLIEANVVFGGFSIEEI